MPTDSQKVMAAAQDPKFQQRVRLALVRTALKAVTGDNSARADFARRILTGKIDITSASMAIAANPTIHASIAAATEGDETHGVADADIAYTMAEADEPAVGVFAKLAAANATG